MASSLARPPAFRMTCASPSSRPVNFAGSRRASMQVRMASRRRGAITGFADSRKPAAYALLASRIFRNSSLIGSPYRAGHASARFGHARDRVGHASHRVDQTSDSAGRLRGALAFGMDQLERLLLAEVLEILLGQVGFGEVDEVVEERADTVGRETLEEGEDRLVRPALVAEQGQEAGPRPRGPRPPDF